MKVSDIMQRRTITVTPKTKLQEVAKLIFGLGIAGVPVVQGRKLVGLITQTDILHKLYPSYKELMDDYVHAKDFTETDEVVEKMLGMSAGEIMNKNITTVGPDLPAMRVQSIMLARHFGRIPVVDKNNNLLGIVSQGDIFRVVVGGKLAIEAEEGFYDWTARYYDLLVDWDKRLVNELQPLVKLFRQGKAKKVLDIASSTGEHTIAIAENGIDIVGLERSTLMHKIAQKKWRELDKSTKKRVQLFGGEYNASLEQLTNDFNAAIFMGNALPHVINTDRHILEKVAKKLQKDSLLIFQISNFEKMLSRDGFRQFFIRKSQYIHEHEHAFLSFYSKAKGKSFTYNLSIFDRIEDKWVFQGINSTPIAQIGKTEIRDMLKKVGFSKISYYGSMIDGPIFKEAFEPKEHDWLNVVAKRG